ncbi:MAG: cytochrome c biogenesis protein CcdA [Gammaproteobacteria bacterium]|nr:cytochrome c biogenesis protein CcdA [Gammaproteobacteria bacterium]MCF6261398.1 cytochrome c biogenesis protein CcdA [Gammaproteobacteria bacterium]
MGMLLLTMAALLGALAFFEPCTIATHTLFSARAHQQSNTGCCRSLLTVWLSRSVLLTGLLVSVVVFIDAPAWGSYTPSIILSAMATLYIVSRFVYLPIPHLTFYRLLPGSKRLPHAVQLGLTLPACTIPLVIVVAGISMTVDSINMAVLAGLLFAGLFTLPMAISAFKGIHADGADLLQRAAKISPFITAFLLYGLAIALLPPMINIDPASLKAMLTEASLLGIGAGFLAGLVFSFNPVSFASIPVVLAYVTLSDNHSKKTAVQLGGAFVLGMLLTHTLLGAIAALGGEWVHKLMGREWGLLLGPLLILLGLMWPGWLKVRLPWLAMRGKKVSGPWGAFLLGIPFSVAVCPFCTPALLVTLTASAAIGSVPFGAGLLLAFAIGRSIPIIIGAWSMGWLESLRMASHHQKKLEVLAGVTLIFTGLYLLNEYLFII